MADLKGSKTHENLKAAFAGESQANRRYLYFAKAPTSKATPRSPATSATPPRARPATRTATSTTSRRSATRPPACRSATPRTTSKAAVAGETHEYTDMYPGMAKTARDEGFGEIADWFETLAKAEKSHAGRFQSLLDDTVSREISELSTPAPERRQSNPRPDISYQPTEG